MVSSVEREEGKAGPEPRNLTDILPGVSGQEVGHCEEAAQADSTNPAQTHLPLNLRLRDEEQEGAEDAEGGDGGGEENYLETATLQAGEIKERKLFLFTGDTLELNTTLLNDSMD